MDDYLMENKVVSVWTRYIEKWIAQNIWYTIKSIKCIFYSVHKSSNYYSLTSISKNLSYFCVKLKEIHNESSRRSLKVSNPLLIYFVTMMLLKNKLTLFLIRSNLTSFLSMCAYIISSCVLIFLTHFLHFLWPSSGTFHFSLYLLSPSLYTILNIKQLCFS